MDRALAPGKYRRTGDIRSGRVSSYEVVERGPYLGERRAWIGEPTWKGLDRATVEILSDGKVLEGFLVGRQDLQRLEALLDHFNIFEATRWCWGWLRG
jgi:hypothetical protein